MRCERGDGDVGERGPVEREGHGGGGELLRIHGETRFGDGRPGERLEGGLGGDWAEREHGGGGRRERRRGGVSAASFHIGRGIGRRRRGGLIGTGWLTTDVDNEKRMLITYLISSWGSCGGGRGGRLGCWGFGGGVGAYSSRWTASGGALFLLLLVFLLLASPYRFKASFYVVHDASDGNLAGRIRVCGNALLNHVEEVVAGCGISSIVCPFGSCLGRAEQRSEAKSSGYGQTRDGLNG